MPERPRRPDLDEPFSLPDDTEPDDVLRRLLGEVGSDEAESVSEEPGEEESDS